MEGWLEDYAASQHWNTCWKAVTAPSQDEWLEGLREDPIYGTLYISFHSYVRT